MQSDNNIARVELAPVALLEKQPQSQNISIPGDAAFHVFHYHHDETELSDHFSLQVLLRILNKNYSDSDVCAAQRFPGTFVTAGLSQKSHFALTANVGGLPRPGCFSFSLNLRCSSRTSSAVKIGTKGAGAAALSTAFRPDSSRSTRHITPTTSKPYSRAASIAWIVDAPVVQTSSTMTTFAPFSRYPSIRCPVPCDFSDFRTRKPWIGFVCVLVIETAPTTGSAPIVNPPIASGFHPRDLISSRKTRPT